MPSSRDIFDEHAEEWRRYREAPWNRLRYHLVQVTLGQACELLGPSCQVLDVGGGDGGDSLSLAARGHRVTIVDRSARLLEQAAIDARAAGTGAKVRIVHAGLDSMTRAGLAPGEFDLVLCHNVLQYQADDAEAVAGMVELLRPGGVISVMAPNPASDVLAAAVRQADPVKALEMVHARLVRSATFEHEMRRLEAEGIMDILESAGCTVYRRFGIRCVSDLISDNELKADPEFGANLERLELALCEREPYLRTARFWQLLAIRRC